MIEGVDFVNRWAVGLVPPVLLLTGLILVEARRRRALIEAFGDGRLVSNYSRLGPAWVRRLRPVALSMALVAVVAGLARPVVAVQATGAGQRPLDVVVVLDVSRSMGAEDYGPGISRLRKARAMLLEALPELEGTRVGLVTFAGAAFPQAPPTVDHGALRYILTDWVFIESAPPGGSDVAQGIRAGIRLLGDRPGPTTLLLFSDGGDAAPDDLGAALADARSKAIRIFAFGLGGPVPSRVPRYDRNGRFAGWLTLNGKVATTRLDEPTLKAITAATDGAYWRVVSGRELRQTLARLQISRVGSPLAPPELFQWPLAAAILLLFVESAGSRLGGWPALDHLRRTVAPRPRVAQRAPEDA